MGTCGGVFCGTIMTRGSACQKSACRNTTCRNSDPYPVLCVWYSVDNEWWWTIHMRMLLRSSFRLALYNIGCAWLSLYGADVFWIVILYALVSGNPWPSGVSWDLSYSAGKLLCSLAKSHTSSIRLTHFQLSHTLLPTKVLSVAFQFFCLLHQLCTSAT